MFGDWNSRLPAAVATFSPWGAFSSLATACLDRKKGMVLIQSVLVHQNIMARNLSKCCEKIALAWIVDIEELSLADGAVLLNMLLLIND